MVKVVNEIALCCSSAGLNLRGSMAKIYSISGYVRLLSDKLKSIEAEFQDAKKLGWHYSCEELRREANGLKRKIIRESRIAGSLLLLRFTP